MSLSEYVETNFMKDSLFNLTQEYVIKYMLTDDDEDFIEFLGFNFENLIMEEKDVTVEDLLSSKYYYCG